MNERFPYIVLPVYRNLALTRACVESVLNSRPEGVTLVIINDASPEAGVRDYCESLALVSDIHVVHNVVNQGFVKSVNMGMRLFGNRDVILLNSDTQVAADWVGRLQSVVISDESVATVSPFSNNAEICSYPSMCYNGTLFPNVSVETLHQACISANDGRWVTLPTAVGFCMYIRRACLSQIGLFDEVAFGRGYGEENDFCLRASAQGWQHALAADCFVYHAGGVSFKGDKNALVKQAEKVIQERFPHYFAEVHSFIAADPVRELRDRIDMALSRNAPARAQQLIDFRKLEEMYSMQEYNPLSLTPAQVQAIESFMHSDRPRLLFFSHGWGGGVQKHIEDLVSVSDADILVARGLGGGGVELQFYLDSEPLLCIRSGGFGAHTFAKWLGFFELFQFDSLHLHHVHGWPLALLQLIEQLNARYDITLHDYYAVSPYYHLKRDGVCCDDKSWPTDDDAWQKKLEPLMLGAERIIAPSQSVASVVQQAYPSSSIEVKSHPEVVVQPVQPYKVLLLGALSVEKGLRQVEQVAQLASREAPGLLLRLIGYTTDIPSFSLSMTGSYEEQELPQLIAAEKPDVVWMPAQVPETYSYTLSQALATGVPIVASKLGSFVDRLTSVKNAQLIDSDASAEIWLDALKQACHYQSVESKVLLDSTEEYGLWYMGPIESQCNEAVGALVLVEHMEHFQQLPPAQDRPIKSLFQYGWKTQHQGVLADVARRLDELDDMESEVAGMQQYRDLNAELQQYKPLKEKIAVLQNDHREEIAVIKNEQRLELEKAETDINHLGTALREAEEELQAVTTRYEVALQGAEQTIALHADNLAIAKSNIADLQKQAQDAQQHIDHQKETLEQLRADNTDLSNSYNAVINSTSWKLTRPLRVMMRVLRRLLIFTKMTLRHLLRPASYFRAMAMVRRGQWRAIAHRLGFELQQREQNQQVTAVESRRRVEQFNEVVERQANAEAELPALELATSGQPQLSIVIPVYGQHPTTYQCLVSIAKNPPSLPYEVVIADDCSPDNAAEALAMVSGVTFYRGKLNLGFVGNMNAGAGQAKGEFLVLLNNDTVVCPGAFDRLLDTFTEQQDIGLVGAKLLNKDGTLQEAGGIIWKDGSGWNWGRNQDASDPRFNYTRDVDYCSGAVLAIKRSLFAEMGGFDTYYMPAYYEDTDLAFRIREKGLRVVYQPAAEVFHIEGVSHGTDENSGIKAHQVTNGKKFFQRWQEVLNGHNDNAVDPENQAHRYTKGNVLVIEACMITPDQDSGSIRMLNLLKVLKDEGYHVTFIADNLEYREKVVKQLNAMGVEVLFNQWAGSVRNVLRKRGPGLDAVFISRHYIASQYAALVRAVAPQAKLVFDTVDLHYVREEREAQLSDDDALMAQSETTKRKELGLINSSDITIVVSEYEKALLADVTPDARVEIVSNIHSHTPDRPDYAEREGILFVGGFRHPPNIDAVNWYAAEVLPHLRRILPGVVTTIIGSHMPDDIKALAADDVRVLGFVEDIEPELQQARVSIAPLRYGAGVKGKVNEAMNYGIPVVATHCAVEGMHAIDGEDVLVAEGPEIFAEKIAQIYKDAKLWRKISAGGIRNLETYFSPEAARPALQRIMQD
ncbi:glycosyltransferase [Gilvimarinus sp. SDUM040013]|uniref:Glycosyltransferase n=1 Tax=Gilvimarinus gilvus TaxID=3058038 RepID=A0ABU4S1W6_9GAMM|nr:glycosyltransferase [Gilvimarinus sp. SDUM040013]MDO3385236.1 glycosyltransferase [Gilvimarinus sp. SDUM040013]MDX6849219.1 glycosyltransferase [Gilvimarinus sp. SDUM040013]